MNIEYIFPIFGILLSVIGTGFGVAGLITLVTNKDHTEDFLFWLIMTLIVIGSFVFIFILNIKAMILI